MPKIKLTDLILKLSQSHLKVSNYMRSSERARWVKSLLSELNLLKCEDTKLSALSGGEKKRLSLAVQVIRRVFYFISPKIAQLNKPKNKNT